MEDPLLSLDAWIAGFGVALAFTCVAAHALYPHIDPVEAKPPGLLSFFSAAQILPRVRGENDATMTVEDIPRSKGGTSSYNMRLFVEELGKVWSPQGAQPLGKAIVAMSFRWWGLSHLLLGMAKLCEFFQPFFVHCLMTYMVSESAGPLTGYKLVAAETLQTLLAMTAKGFTTAVLAARLADPLAGAISLLVTRKVSKLSPGGLMCTSAAQVQQAIQDADEIRVVLAESSLSGLAINAVGVIYALVKLYGLAGTLPLLVGMVISVVVFAVAQGCQAKGFEGMAALQGKNVERLGIINRLLANFKTVRLLDSMPLFLEPLEEMAVQTSILGRRLGVCMGVGMHLVKFLNYIWVLIFYFFTVLVRGEKVVFATGYLTYMFTVMLATNLMALLGGLQAWRHLHFKAAQVEALLRLPERESAPAKGPLEVSAADFAWPIAPSAEKPEWGAQQVLSGVDFKPQAGELVLVCGSVGAGKSSLLRSLLGHTQCLSGTVRVPAGPVAFQPQEPFLLDASIRENVLLGIPDEECKEADLQRALAVSQLVADFRDPKSTLHALRERTATGKQGSNLSGGQRARSALARTVYSVFQGAKLAVLDDPVAQVDNEVMDAAWSAAVVQAMRGATRIVAVNSQLLGRVALTADRLVLLKDGKITYNGPPSAAIRSPELAEALGCEVQLSPKQAEADSGSFPSAEDEGAAAAGGQPDGALRSGKSGQKAGGGDPAMELADLVRDTPALRKFVAGSKVPEEGGGEPLQLSAGGWAALQTTLLKIEGERKTSAAGKSFSKAYATLALFKRVSMWLVPAAVPVVIGSLSSYSTCWTVRQWEVGNTRGLGNFGWFLFLLAQYVVFTACEAAAFIGVGFGMCAMALSLNRDIVQTFRTLGMSYFWREGSEAEIKVRKVCSLELDRFLNVAKVPIQVLVCLVHMCPVLYNAPQLAPVLALVSPMIPRIIRIRTWTVRHLQPCEQTLKAKQGVLALDLFDGTATLRALQREERFDLLFQESLYSGLQLRYWTGFAAWRAELLTWVVRSAFVVGGIMAIVRRRQLGGEAWTAQVLYFNATVICNLLASLVGEYLNCAKLLEDYSMLEAFLQNDCREPGDGDSPPKGWPSGGAISFESVTFRYAPHMHPALKGLNVEIRAGEKVGVVGKTGSGKSTLVSLLFRLGPAKGHTTGRVRVDGVDLSSLKLSALRRVVCLVPQEPAWFNCSLRAQVSHEHSDAEILAALERCGLDARQITRTSTSPEALSKELLASDLSVGQKQLLMVARALVRRPKILVLDESTAFLDGESADRLLEVIASQCKESTVLSIAHRLRFVLESDRILVMSGGQAIAFDTPAKLLEDQDGYFATNWRLEKQESDA